MNDMKQASLGIMLGVFCAGCANIPTAESCMETQRSFTASFEDLWSRSVRTVEDLQGTVLAQDKSAGVIACKIPYDAKGPEEYVNIYIQRPNAGDRACCVYVVPYTFFVGRGQTQHVEPGKPKEILLLEFDDIYFRKDHLSEIGSAFLDTLTDYVGQGKS